jgi:pyridoxine kinase
MPDLSQNRTFLFEIFAISLLEPIFAGSCLTANRLNVNILSIQSSVAYGHVGNSAAVFPLQRIGVEVWPVNTVQFSNHTGYGKWRGAVVAVEVVRDVLQGIEERGLFPDCDGVLSGYLGDAELGEVILGAYDHIKRVNSRATYCLDPVMGDVGRGFFVRPGIPEFMRDRALPVATLVTPNQFELQFLSGSPVRDFETVLAAVKALQARGPSVVLVTSLCREDARNDEIEVLAADPDSAHVIATPKLPIVVNGAGDTAAALFYAHWLRTQSTRSALELTVNAIFAVLEKTVEDAAREIQLIAAQDAIANPPKRFAAQEVA